MKDDKRWLELGNICLMNYKSAIILTIFIPLSTTPPVIKASWIVMYYGILTISVPAPYPSSDNIGCR